MKKSSRKPRSATPDPAEALSDRLREALSDDELQTVLVRSLLALDEAGRERLLDGLDAETRDALRLALDPPKKGPSRDAAKSVVVGRRKLQQEWEALWRRWDEIVEESGEEKGRYVQQDHDWDPPYLIRSEVADDLEVVGAQLRTMTPALIAADLAPDLRYAEILKDLDDEVGAGLPEWIESADGNELLLGPETSSLVLEWDWAMEQAKGVGWTDFLDDWRDTEERLTNVILDDQSIRAFVLGQPEPARRAFLESVTRQRASPRWSVAFNQARGVWAELVRELSARWNPVLFAETSRANIAHDWTLALPLVKDAIARKRFDEAATLIDEAVRVRLRLEPKQRWDPRATLLAHAERWYAPADRHTATLLGLWQKVAAAQGDGDLAAALTLQRVALEDAERGDAMLKAFNAVPPRSEAVRAALFAEWRAWFVARTLSQQRNGPMAACGRWVAALVDAAAIGAEGTEIFRAAVCATLDEARAMKLRARDPRHFSYAFDHSQDPLFALALLTLDLDAARPTLAKSAPRLRKLLQSVLHGERSPLDESRRRWIARLDGAAVLPEVLGFWRENAARFVPDPGVSTGDYARSADWVAAVHELDPGAAAAILACWAGVHRLKRNLWRDLAQRGLPASARSP